MALWLRDELAGSGLDVVCPKTSGSKGLQLYVPLDPPRPATRSRHLAHELARAWSATTPTPWCRTCAGTCARARC